jgi:large subunit ribosomal protein L31
MKKDTHPTFFQNASFVCSCGKRFSIGSTKENVHVEICSACHPFYSGNEKIIDTAGRVEKFKARAAASKVRGKSNRK